MIRARKSGSDNQRQRFIEKARELGCDESEAAFEERLRKIAKVKPSNEAKATPKGRGSKTPS
jgi:hypothetical protein